MGCPPCWNCTNIAWPPGCPGSRTWKHQKQFPKTYEYFRKEISMIERKRPQFAPEVLERPSTQSAEVSSGQDKRMRFVSADIVAAVEQPSPKAVGRPIVEVSPELSPDVKVETQSRGLLRDLPPKAVGRPIVEVSPDVKVEGQSAEPMRDPLPKPVARPIVEVVADFTTVEKQSAEPMRDPLPKPVARPIVEVVADFPRVETQSSEPVRDPLPKPVARPIVEVIADFTVERQSEEPVRNPRVRTMDESEDLVMAGAKSAGEKVRK